MLIAIVVATPVLVVLGSFLAPEADIWQHLADNVLGGLILNTLKLLFCVIPLTAVLGISMGWLTAGCEYPGRRFFSWALVLPFAIPPYVFAFVYLGIFDFSGPVQGVIRDVFPAIGFIDIRNTAGVSLILSLAFYPYVYLMSRSAFLSQGPSTMEAARTLGQSPVGAFFRVALPMARPWVAAGLLLVAMETLADFGAVAIFNYDTFTTAIYKAWFGMFSLNAALQLSSILVVFVLTVLVLEQRFRQRLRFHETGAVSAPDRRLKLTGVSKWLAFTASLTLFLLAFALPCSQLGLWAWNSLNVDALRHLEHALNTLLLGMVTAVVTTAIAIVIAYSKSSNPGPVMRWASRLATLGYALPGTVLAVGVFIPAAWLDNRLLNTLGELTGIKAEIFIQGSLGLLIVAYAIRFMAAGFGSVDSAMQRITPSIVEAARSMGTRGTALLKRIYLPMTRTGVFTAAIFVLVDVMKEMPITLMMRPFNWDTLAVKIFEYTSEGEWELAALPAVGLILTGLLPVLLLTQRSESIK
ncbi:MAG: binding-protein-dependent transport system inner membrane protein [Nitrospinaceae bacterium]|nr:MAG: binding-protein-dependent transport system inner membrane protein [Nitrospinaceae bacterium]